ncbi:ABC transporter substrate-binding protein [Methylobacterium sp. NEAU K]|uniref:ABC transporter substrate-binding protein n=1 Tax=Methylobacterium sp. NEAU K TaxID=3064946 RepID=UPI0027325847|nr:ABC transporter substrate-binding protein [Methylobacterium sp. NEAU K]MDP4006487.1 ABC transporter substrate-binding protein [Methylobacterium sp. NEAU K]
MRRRDVIAGVGAAVAWPAEGCAQAGAQRRLGILLVYGESHPDVPIIVDTLRGTLQQLGWTWNRNLAVDLRLGNGDPEKMRRQTDEILAKKPDVVFAQGVVGTTALQRATSTTPVVFIQVQDPVGGGFVTSLSRPGGNLTGFTNFDYAFVGKWLQLLKELSRGVTRTLAIINPDYPARFAGYAAELARIGPELGIDARIAGVHDAAEIAQAITAFVEAPSGGLIVLPDAVTGVHSQLIVDLAAQCRLPAVYAYAAQVRIGGLAAYTTSVSRDVQQAAGYIDRILRGTAVGGLPVQASERFLTLINLRTAAALGLTITPSLLAKADELIE